MGHIDPRSAGDTSRSQEQSDGDRFPGRGSRRAKGRLPEDEDPDSHLRGCRSGGGWSGGLGLGDVREAHLTDLSSKGINTLEAV